MFFALGELGGARASAAHGSSTTTSEIDETVNLTQLASRQDLVVGFYNGTVVGVPAASGPGVLQVNLDIYVNGVDVDSQKFYNDAQARAYFTDNSVDLGSLATGNTLSLREVMTVTTINPGTGFYGDLIIGDPPPAHPAPRAHQLAQAMATFQGASAPASAALHGTATGPLTAPLVANLLQATRAQLACSGEHRA